MRPTGPALIAFWREPRSTRVLFGSVVVSGGSRGCAVQPTALSACEISTNTFQDLHLQAVRAHAYARRRTRKPTPFLSRGWNGVSADQLASRKDAGAHALSATVASTPSSGWMPGQFVFFQGHPEYRVRDAYGPVPDSRNCGISRARWKLTRCCRWTTSRKRPSGLYQEIEAKTRASREEGCSARSLPCSTASGSATPGAQLTAALIYHAIEQRAPFDAEAGWQQTYVWRGSLEDAFVGLEPTSAPR